MMNVMKTLGILMAALLAAGCSGMSNEEIVKQTNYCKENDMGVRTVFNGLTYETMKVICIPRKESGE